MSACAGPSFGFLLPARPGLRLKASGDASAAPTRVLRVEPGDGARLVFRDTPIVVRFSRPLEPGLVGARTVRLLELGDALVPCRLLVSPDARIVLVSPERLLACGLEHQLVIAGLRDATGRDVAPHESRFVPCDLVWEDLSG